MLESINIQGFRKYEELSLKQFGRINFILGDNNIGKTSILEAIYAWACGQNIIPFINIPLARGRYSNIQLPYWMMEEILATVHRRDSLPLHMAFSGICEGKSISFQHTIYPSDLLTDFDTTYKKSADKTIPKTNDIAPELSSTLLPVIPGIGQLSTPVIVARWEIEFEGKKNTTNITAPATQVANIKPYRLAKFIDLLSHIGIAENVQIYAVLKREKVLEEVTNEIRKVFPEIKGFDMLPYPDGSQSPISIMKNDGSYLPMYAFGDGIQRWFYILGSIILHKNSIICIDEIDTGFHRNAQNEFCKHLIHYAEQNNVQLFLTTHNIEFIEEFLSSMYQMNESNKHDIRIITMRNTEQGLKIRNLSAEEAQQARMCNKVELR